MLLMGPPALRHPHKLRHPPVPESLLSSSISMPKVMSEIEHFLSCVIMQLLIVLCDLQSLGRTWRSMGQSLLGVLPLPCVWRWGDPTVCCLLLLFFVTDPILQALLASKAVVQSAKRDAKNHLDKSAENLRVVMENQKLKERNKVLEDLRVLRNDQVDCLTKKDDEQEKLFKNCRSQLMIMIGFWKTFGQLWRRMPWSLMLWNKRFHNLSRGC